MNGAEGNPSSERRERMRKPNKRGLTRQNRTTICNAALAECYAASQIMDYQSDTGLVSFHAFGLLSWLYTVSPFAEIDVCVVDGARQVTIRMSFWLWFRTLATWLDLYKLTCGPSGRTKRADKSNPRSHRVRHAPELKRETKSLASTAGPRRAGDQDGIVSGKVEADGVRRQSGKRKTPELLIDSAAISEAALSGLIEDWIVPAVVGRLIRELLAEPPEATKG